MDMFQGRIWLLSFTERGAATAKRILTGLQTWEGTESTHQESRALEEPLSDFVRRVFGTGDALIFVGAAGIAVRLIAPYIKKKTSDPAVVVVDELGQFAIPILSGHLGGANELARGIAAFLGGTAVITTATDLHGAFAVDLFAKKNWLAIESMEEAKKISAAVLQGGSIGFFSDVPVMGECPAGLTPGIRQEHNVFVRMREFGSEEGYGKEGQGGEGKKWVPDGTCVSGELRLFPRYAVLGMGCRRGVSLETIRAAALAVLDKAGLDRRQLLGLVTVDLKKEEPGLLALAREWQLSFMTFSAEELSEAEGSFLESEFVRSVAGVGNVCERAAVCGAAAFREMIGEAPEREGEQKVRLLAGKLALHGVTAAVASFSRSGVLTF